MKIYHNPRCRKSRETLNIIKEAGKEVDVIEYLKDVPSAPELMDLLKKLQLKASDIIRKGEAVYKEKYKGKTLSEEEWIFAMIENPKLIERPIVINEKHGIIGRPPEKVLSLFA